MFQQPEQPCNVFPPLTRPLIGQSSSPPAILGSDWLRDRRRMWKEKLSVWTHSRLGRYKSEQGDISILSSVLHTGPEHWISGDDNHEDSVETGLDLSSHNSVSDMFNLVTTQ